MEKNLLKQTYAFNVLNASPHISKIELVLNKNPK